MYSKRENRVLIRLSQWEENGMLTLPSGNIAIWGIGKLGKKNYFRLRDCCDVKCFFDNDIRKVGQEIVEGVKLEQYNGQKYYIIIASGWWKEISIQLQRGGLKLVKDFLPVNLLFVEKIRLDELLDVFEMEDIMEYLKIIKKNRGLAMVYGNCQMELICNMLEFNVSFRKDFVLLRIPPVHLYKDVSQINQVFYSRIIGEIDLFICQNVSLKNGYAVGLSSEMISRQLRPQCRIIRIHNIYFDGYFLQIDNTIAKRIADNSERYGFPYWDRYIHNLKLEGLQSGSIVDIISNTNFISKEEILEKCEKSIAELQKRERNVDVGVVEYIKRRYLVSQLFYTRNHPCNEVLYVYTNSLLEVLGDYERNPQMSESEMVMHFGNMKYCDWPLYPSVVSALGLQSWEKYFYTYSVMDTQLYRFDEFMREYIGRCYGGM